MTKPIEQMNTDEVMEALGLEPWKIHEAKAIARNDEIMTKTHGSHWRGHVYNEIISRGTGRTTQLLMQGFMHMLRGHPVYVSAYTVTHERCMISTLREWARKLGIDPELAKGCRDRPRPGEFFAVVDHFYPRVSGRSASFVSVDEKP